MCRLRGLELQFNLVKNHLQSKYDCLMTVLHVLFVNEGLECVGTGENFPEDVRENGSELLPSRWNENQDAYVLRYTSRDGTKRYLVKTLRAGGSLHCNIMEDDDVTAALAIKVDKYVNSDFSQYDDTYKNLNQLKEAFQKDIVQKMLRPAVKQQVGTSKHSGRSVGHSTEPGTRMPNPWPVAQVPDPCAGRRGVGRGGFPSIGSSDLDPFSRGGFPSIGSSDLDPLRRGGFPSIGSSDLDPLSRGGGGMLMDPSFFGVPRSNIRPMGDPFGLPRGSVPPGARFDPMGPVMPGGNRPRNNPDHFQPPGFGFDDFM